MPATLPIETRRVQPSAQRTISQLAEITGRAQPNLTRTLAKLEAVGFVRMRLVNRRKVPTASVRRLRVEIDPSSQNDRLEIV